MTRKRNRFLSYSTDEDPQQFALLVDSTEANDAASGKPDDLEDVPTSEQASTQELGKPAHRVDCFSPISDPTDTPEAGPAVTENEPPSQIQKTAAPPRHEDVELMVHIIPQSAIDVLLPPTPQPPVASETFGSGT